MGLKLYLFPLFRVCPFYVCSLSSVLLTDGATTDGTAHAGPGASDSQHACRGSATGAETDAWRASVPTDPRHVSRHGRKDHWNAARDRQLGTAAYAGVSRVSQGKGELMHFLLCCYLGHSICDCSVQCFYTHVVG